MDLIGLQVELERICLALQGEKIDTLEVITRVVHDLRGSVTFYPLTQTALHAPATRCIVKLNAEDHRHGLGIDTFSHGGPKVALHGALSDCIEQVRAARFGFTREEQDIAYDILTYTKGTLMSDQINFIRKVYTAAQKYSTEESTREFAREQLDKLDARTTPARTQ